MRKKRLHTQQQKQSSSVATQGVIMGYFAPALNRRKPLSMWCIKMASYTAMVTATAVQTSLAQKTVTSIRKTIKETCAYL